MSFNIPHEFIAGTKAKAQEVNENFSAIADGIDQIYADILTEKNELNHSISVLDDKIDVTDNKIETFLGDFSECTHFCINRAKLDVSGNPAVLSNNSNVISFDVDNDNPLYATTCEGNYFSLSSIDDITLPTLTDGTYTVYIDSEGTTYYHSSSPTLVNKLPDLPSLNQICILSKQEPLAVYEYNGEDWEITKKVPVGQFTSTSGTISNVLTYKYNQNGYNININSYTQDFSEAGWCKLPNNFILQWGKYSFSANEVINFPIAFPNACLSITAGDNYSNLGASAHVNIAPISKSQFQIASGLYQSGAMAGTAHVIAIGY